MSEESAPVPAHEPASTAGPVSPAPVKPKKPHKWRRRFFRLFLVLLVLVVLVRVAVVFVFPRVLSRVAASYGLSANYERLELHALSGDLGIWHLAFTPKEGGDSILVADYARGNISILELFRGRLVVYRVEADGIDVMIERNEKGEIPLLDRFIGAQAKAEAERKEKLRLNPQDVDLTAPLRLDALRVQYVTAHFRDKSVTPAVDTRLELNVRVSDVDSKTRPTKFQVDVACPPLLDSLRIEGEGTARGKVLNGDMQITLRGLHPKPAAGYLRPLGIQPVADSISMQMNASIKTTGIPVPGATSKPVEKGKAPEEALKGTLLLTNITASADNVEIGGVDRITLEADALADGLAQFSKLAIEGVRANASRTAAGNISVAGLELIPVPTAAAVASSPSPATSPATTSPVLLASTTQPTLPFKFSLGEFSVKNLRAAFADQAITPAGNVAFEIEDLSVKNIVSDADQPDAKADLAALFHLPGIAGTVSLKGSATPFAAKKSADVSVQVEKIFPEALRTYLSAAGLESDLKGGSFAGTLNTSAQLNSAGVWSADASLGQLLFKDRDELLALDHVKITDARLDPIWGGLRIAAIDVSGPAISAKRDASGALVTLGLRSKKPATRPAAPHVAPAPGSAQAAIASSTTTPTTTPSAAAVMSIPKIEVGRLTWKGFRLRLTDEGVTPATSLELADLALEINDFSTVTGPDGAKPGKINLTVNAPKLADALTVTGTIQPRDQGVTIHLDVSGLGLTGKELAPYLGPLGVEPVLKQGSLKLTSDIDLDSNERGIAASLKVKDLQYKEGTRELAGVDSLNVAGIQLGSESTEIASIDVVRPRAAAVRDADGSFLVGGLRIPPPPAAPTTPPAVAPVAAAPSPAPATQPAASSPPPAALAIILKKADVKNASLQWTDRMVAPQVDTTASIDAKIADIVLGRAAKPGSLNLTVRAAPTLDELTVGGTVSLAPENLSADLSITARGIREGVLKSYLPPGTAISMKEGSFQTKLSAGVTVHPKGGQGLKLIVSDLRLTDGEKAPLLSLESFKAIVERLDLQNGRLAAIDEISLAGLETDLTQDKDGALHVVGLTLGGAAPEVVAAKTPAATQPIVKAHPPGLASVPPTVPTTQPAASNVSALIAEGRKPIPLITLKKLDVNVRRVSYQSLAVPDAAPLVLSDLHLGNVSNIELFGDDSIPRAPAKLELKHALKPIMESVSAKIEWLPAGAQTDLKIDLLAEGIRGEGITEVLPQLKPTIDGSAMKNGRFAAHLESQLRMDRRSLIAVDFSKGLDLDLLLKGIELRSEPKGPILAGVDEVRSDAIHIDPVGQNVIFKSIEVTKPQGYVFNDAAGLHVAGIVIKPAPAPSTTQPATAPAAPPQKTPAVTTASTQAAPAPPGGEIRIDKFLVGGLDFKYEDRAVKPMTIVPLNGLDMEVRGISTRAMIENKPIRFSLAVTTGKVPLPKKRSGGAAPKALGGLGSMVMGKAAEPVPELEQRDFLSQVTADGNISLYPALKGWVKTSASGVELYGIAGIAKASGVTIGGGVLDNTLDLRMPGDGSMDVRTKTVFTDLSMSEPPNGPISRGLILPAPLDVVIDVLQDADGAITVPLRVPLKEGQISFSAATGSAVSAFGEIVVKAIASSPVKVVSGVGNLVGLIPGKKEGPAAPVQLQFRPGDAGLSGASSNALAAVIEQLRKDKSLGVTLTHQLGGGDILIAQLRANPSPADSESLAYQYRLRKMELLSNRREVAAVLRGELASGLESQAAASTEQLRALDRELAGTEDALDRVYDLLKPGAERQADRRTRAASLEIAQARLDSLRAKFIAAGVVNAADRIRTARPTFDPAEGIEGGKASLTVAKIAPK